MTTKVIRRAQLIKGGDIIKQGETFTLGFRLFDANDRIIQLESADVVTVKIANRTGIIKEVTASKVDDYIEFTVNESIGHGEMRVELTVTNGSNIQKYPAREWIRLLITQSLDDAGVGGIQAITAQQMFSRIEGAEAKATTAETKAVSAETTATNVQRDFDLILAEAGDSNPEIVAARLGEDNLRVFNEKTIALLADKATKQETDLELFKKRDKTIKISFDDLRQDVKDAFTGGTAANVGIGAVGNENLQTYAVKPKNTTFLGSTYNMFNPLTITRGIQLNPDTGANVNSDAYSTSDFIEVEPNTDLFINGTHGFHRYDDAGNWLGGTLNATGVRNTGDATKIRVSVLNSFVYSLMIVEGTSAPSFIENGYEGDFVRTQYQMKKVAEDQAKQFDSFEQKRDEPFEKIDLLNGSTLSSNNRMLIREEYELRYRNRRRSFRLDLMTSTAELTLALQSPLALEGVSEFVAIVYVEDASKIDSLQIAITGTSWVRPHMGTLVNGWNVLRYQGIAGSLTTWGEATSIRLISYFNSKTTIFVSDIYAIKPEKAKILFVNDHGYHNFKEVAYPQLKALGIPTTWAINPGRLGETISAMESILTQADIDELAYDPYSEFSIHNWNPIGNATATMTADQLLEDTYKCMTYLRKNGIMPRHLWRAAFTQNLAPEHAVLQPLMDAYATPTANAGVEMYPFRNRYNVNRDAIHGTSRNEAYFDEMFSKLKKTRSLYVCYTHGIDDLGGIHMTTSQFNYFASKISEGVSEGWLEGTTYSKLRGQYSFNDYSEVL